MNPDNVQQNMSTAPSGVVTTQDKSIPVSIRVISVLLIVLGFVGVCAYLILAGASLVFMMGAGPAVYIVLMMMALNTLPSIISIITGFGIRRFKKWSAYLLVLAFLLTIGRLVFRVGNHDFANTNMLEPIWYLICLAVCYMNKERFV